MRKVLATLFAMMLLGSMAGTAMAGNWTCRNGNYNPVGSASCDNSSSPNDYYNPGGQNPPGKN